MYPAITDRFPSRWRRAASNAAIDDGLLASQPFGVAAGAVGAGSGVGATNGFGVAGARWAAVQGHYAVHSPPDRQVARRRADGGGVDFRDGWKRHLMVISI